MKKISLFLYLVMMFSVSFGQSKTSGKNNANISSVRKVNLDKTNEDIPALIPQKKGGKFGYITQKGEVAISHLYSNVGFFAEDCNLLNSKNENVRKFGTEEYASVRYNGVDYRIDTSGKRVYQYKDEDLAKCPFLYKEQKYYSYIRNGFYGIVKKEDFTNEEDYRQYTIYPQYEYLHIMEGDDLDNPMIIASINNRFGVIDIHNKIIIPFEYSDIKRNFSWKLAKMFEVTKDGQNYYFIDSGNKAY